jgi:hypothetical protein
LPIGILFALKSQKVGAAMIPMDFSTPSKKFLSLSTAAYNKFENHQIPFAAVKIYISGSRSDRDEFDDLVRNNFRREKDVLLKSNNHYAVLMQNTSLEAAEEATNRLGLKLCRFTCNFGKPKNNLQLNASACLYGTGKETNQLHFKYLDLTDIFCRKKGSEIRPSQFVAYLKWLERIKIKEHQPLSIIV